MDALLKDKKHEDIGKMFDDIAPGYDFLNHFLSFNIDRLWRKKLIGLLKKENPGHLLDVATGTADLAIMAAQKITGSHVVGIDISEKMLETGRVKVRKSDLEKQIELLKAPVEKLPFDDHVFDAVMVAFGVRNFEDLTAGLKEMLRVARSGKRIYIIEFSKPQGFFKILYNIYFKLYLPVAGRIISGNKSAYKYLYNSVVNFPEGNHFLNILQDAGYRNVRQIRLSGGISSIYTAEK
ncbi:MAG TPA: bifunctional demethylmenaquinone methyltransferase/2-methoxy-6-polyprenyl-1,4-benzoquinol methylase UbiE [Bacteroidales bacterium]|nr:bifunctional demethylmenaquinone methyltransferase/2-methoxy-6-polyprenyl-1,4-benzoquinol methylase UbiE [Bacteroidales bacterium]